MGIDDWYVVVYFVGIGFEIMGVGMFGFYSFVDNLDWQGWWGDELLFYGLVVVFMYWDCVLIEFVNGIWFEFVVLSVEQVFVCVCEFVGDVDVRIGGGVSIVCEFLVVGFVD